MSEKDLCNLYDELVEILNRQEKSVEDIKFVRGAYYNIPLDNFIEVAKKTYYDPGFGGQEVAMDLTIVLDDMWLSRGEYDGSEWFEVHRMPRYSYITKEIKTLVSPYKYWKDIEFLNQVLDDEEHLWKTI